MADAQKPKAKGRKIGRNRKPSGSSTKYKARELAGNTAKCRRVVRAFSRGSACKGWFLTEKGRARRG